MDKKNISLAIEKMLKKATSSPKAIQSITVVFKGEGDAMEEKEMEDEDETEEEGD